MEEEDLVELDSLRDGVTRAMGRVELVPKWLTVLGQEIWKRTTHRIVAIFDGWIKILV